MIQYRKDYYKYEVRAINFNDNNNEIGDGNDNNYPNVQSLFIAWVQVVLENTNERKTCVHMLVVGSK